MADPSLAGAQYSMQQACTRIVRIPLEQRIENFPGFRMAFPGRERDRTLKRVFAIGRHGSIGKRYGLSSRKPGCRELTAGNRDRYRYRRDRKDDGASPEGIGFHGSPIFIVPFGLLLRCASHPEWGLVIVHNGPFVERFTISPDAILRCERPGWLVRALQQPR